MNVPPTQTVVMEQSRTETIVQNGAQQHRNQLIGLFTSGGILLVAGILVLLFASIIIGAVLLAMGLGFILGGAIRICVAQQNANTTTSQQPYSTGTGMITTTYPQTTVIQATQPPMTTNYHQPAVPLGYK